MRIQSRPQLRLQKPAPERRCAEAWDKARDEGFPLVCSIIGGITVATSASAGLLAVGQGAGAIAGAAAIAVPAGMILGMLVTHGLLLPALVPYLEQQAKEACK